MTIKRRAVRDEQKEVRRQAILDVAAGLLEGTGYDEITIAQVAAAAGLAKGTIYLYFQTKEELFLALQTDLLVQWFGAMDQALEAMTGEGQGDGVATLLCESLLARPMMTRLQAILHTMLEHNIPYEAALGFKQTMRHHLEATGGRLEAALPFLHPGDGMRLLLQINALVIGFQHQADAAPVVREVWQREPTLTILEVDFGRDFSAAFKTLLRGWEEQSRGEP